MPSPNIVRAELRRTGLVIGLAVVAGLALLVPVGPGPAMVGIGLFLAMTATADDAVGRTHPRGRLGLANRITLARGGGVAILAAMALEPATLTSAPVAWTTLAGVALLLALDGIDGLAARRQRLVSEFGARFDMEVDALLILVLSVMALRTGAAGPWVLALGTMRYAFVVAGFACPALRRDLPPSLRRKAVCVFQVVVLTGLLAPPVTQPVSSVLAAVALAALAASFATDLRWLARAS